MSVTRDHQTPTYCALLEAASNARSDWATADSTIIAVLLSLMDGSPPDPERVEDGLEALANVMFHADMCMDALRRYRT